MMPRDDIVAVYQQGVDAVVDLVQNLSAQLDDQHRMIASLTARLNELEDRLAKNSRNSSKPPSSDDPPAKPKPKSLRRTSAKKKPGGQKGHPGTTLSLVKDPHHLVVYSPEECEGCGESLSEAVASSHERRQVVDVPPLLGMEVTEHRIQSKRCAGCGRSTKAAFPLEASIQGAVAYGPRIKALMAYLVEYQLLPYERASELLGDLFGGSAPGAGTLYSTVERCFEGLEEAEEAIKEGLLGGAGVGNFDETGLRVGGEGMWVHVASTPSLTHYAVHEKRGVEATKEIGILPFFKGVAVHDGLSSYRHYEQCLHALCATPTT
jgi:transposase